MAVQRRRHGLEHLLPRPLHHQRLPGCEIGEQQARVVQRGHLDVAVAALPGVTVSGLQLRLTVATAVPAGALVCSYHGETLTLQQVRERYGQGATGCDQTADYLFELRPASESQAGLYVDGANTDHPGTHRDPQADKKRGMTYMASLFD